MFSSLFYPMSLLTTHIIFCANKKASISTSMDYLINAGIQTHFAQNEESLLKLINNDNSCVVIIELDFKPKDAISLTNELKQLHSSNIFVIIFTDKPDDYVQITAFDNGADDFIITPLKPILLQKRIQAITSRLALQTKDVLVSARIKKFDINKETYTILLNGKIYTLPRKEFEMMYLMFHNSHKVFTRHEFSEKIWKEKLNEKSRIIDIHIRNIRKILGEDVIQTVKGTGYLFNSALLN